MYCTECGEEVEEESKFCTSCGAYLEETAVTRPEIREGEGTEVTLEDVIERPDLLTALAGVLLVIGAFGPWNEFGKSGWDMPVGKTVLASGLVMLYSSGVEMGYVQTLKELFPVEAVSAVAGFLVLVLALTIWNGPFGGGWGLYLTVIASLIAFFSVHQSYERK